MRVFVAGATGALGRPVVAALVAAGHDVVAMTRRTQKTARLVAAGAVPVVCDALDASSLSREVAKAAPDTVVHLLTALPDRYNPRRLADAYRATDRLRREGTDNLVAAARAAGARRLVVESVAFAYERTGPSTKSEDAPLDPNPPSALVPSAQAIAHNEQAAEASGLDTVVLRYGFLYGPGTWYAPGGYFAEETQRRRMPIVGGGQGVFSFAHVDDAAAATLLAVEADAVTGTFNVADDEPAPISEWLPVYARAVGAPPPRHVPAWLARVAAGRAMVAQLTTCRGAKNAKAKAVLRWTPARPTWRTGFADQMSGPASTP